MHRSGTSLLANWLAYCGLDLGDETIPGDYSNPAGHYEDQAFVAFHRDILRENGLDYLVSKRHMLVISETQRVRAKQLILSRTAKNRWGWKDPRTALFLDFWKSLLPDLRVLVVYRHYAQVVDSLLRRESQRPHHHAILDSMFEDKGGQGIKSYLSENAPTLFSLARRSKHCIETVLARVKYWSLSVQMVQTYLKVWNQYNQDILSFANSNPESCLVIDNCDLLPRASSIIDYLNAEWGFDLKQVSAELVYDPGLLKTKPMPIRSYVSSLLVSDCEKTYGELERFRQTTLRRLGQCQRVRQDSGKLGYLKLQD